MSLLFCHLIFVQLETVIYNWKFGVGTLNIIFKLWKWCQFLWKWYQFLWKWYHFFKNNNTLLKIVSIFCKQYQIFWKGLPFFKWYKIFWKFYQNSFKWYQFKKKWYKNLRKFNEIFLERPVYVSETSFKIVIIIFLYDLISSGLFKFYS